jgi:hypothetical protein
MITKNIPITFTLAQAWYKSGNSTLKSLALKAFTEEELNIATTNRVKDFEELQDVGTVSIPSVESLNKAFIAYAKLILLRNKYVEGWPEDWLNDIKYVIRFDRTCPVPKITQLRSIQSALSFPTCEMAHQFADTFKDLLVQAKEVM